MRIVRPWIATTLVVVAILYLTLWPDPVPDTGITLFEGVDKVVHAIMFGGLTLTLIFDSTLSEKGARPSWCLTLWFALISTIFGAAIEFMQRAMGLGRAFSWWDIVADAVVALVAVCLGAIAVKLARKCIKSAD